MAEVTEASVAEDVAQRTADAQPLVGKTIAAARVEQHDPACDGVNVLRLTMVDGTEFTVTGGYGGYNGCVLRRILRVGPGRGRVVTDWARYLDARDQLQRWKLDDALRKDFEAMGPEQALPLMLEVIAGGKDAVRRLNAVKAEVTQVGPWCPVCRQKTPTRGVYQPPNGFYEVFTDHGCDGDGRKVKDVDHGFLVDSKVVPQWEM